MPESEGVPEDLNRKHNESENTVSDEGELSHELYGLSRERSTHCDSPLIQEEISIEESFSDKRSKRKSSLVLYLVLFLFVATGVSSTLLVISIEHNKELREEKEKNLQQNQKQIDLIRELKESLEELKKRKDDERATAILLANAEYEEAVNEIKQQTDEEIIQKVANAKAEFHREKESLMNEYGAKIKEVEQARGELKKENDILSTKNGEMLAQEKRFAWQIKDLEKQLSKSLAETEDWKEAQSFRRFLTEMFQCIKEVEENTVGVIVSLLVSNKYFLPLLEGNEYVEEKAAFYDDNRKELRILGEKAIENKMFGVIKVLLDHFEKNFLFADEGNMILHAIRKKEFELAYEFKVFEVKYCRWDSNQNTRNEEEMKEIQSHSEKTEIWNKLHGYYVHNVVLGFGDFGL